MPLISTNDPDQDTRTIEAFLAGGSQPVEEKAVRDVPAPPSLSVELPAGLLDVDGRVTREATVRELNGFDEEELSRWATNTAKTLEVLLERGVALLGDSAPTKETLSQLTVGDREMLLLAIRKATYGSTVTFTGIYCPHCESREDLEIDLDTDVAINNLASDEGRQFEVKLSRGTAIAHMPDGFSQMATLADPDASPAQTVTTILRWCVDRIGGVPVLSDNDIRRLSARDRNTLVDEIAKRRVGPDFRGVKKACPSCGEDIATPLSLLSLFRF